MHMSYRRAWLLIDELNRIFGAPLIETKQGGAAGGGAVLTPLGSRVIRRYRSIEAKAHKAGAADLAELAAAVPASAGDTRNVADEDPSMAIP